MKTILVATDFSEPSRNAAIYAGHLAQHFQASIVLIHAYMLPTPVSEVPYVMVNAEEMQKENEGWAKDQATKLHDEFGIHADYSVKLGFPSEEIELLAEEIKADLSVMGMKGSGTLDKIIGSTTTSTLKKVKTPLIIVPRDTSYKEIRQVTYATDLSYPTSVKLYEPLIKFIQSFNAKLNIVHVLKQETEEKPGETKLDPIFKDIPHSFSTVVDNDIKHGIQTYLQNHSTDLLVMVAHEHSWWARLFGKSNTKSMIYETHIPLLVLKDKK